MRNHLGNTEDRLTLNVSRMFPRLHTQATYLVDAEFVSRKQKCFASFPFAHPYNIVSNIDSKCFCSNVSSFPLTLKLRFLSSTKQNLLDYLNYVRFILNIAGNAYEIFHYDFDSFDVRSNSIGLIISLTLIL